VVATTLVLGQKPSRPQQKRELTREQIVTNQIRESEYKLMDLRNQQRQFEALAARESKAEESPAARG
jgi:hypothetical protein